MVGRLEFLRPEHGEDEIGEAGDRDDADDDVLHG
jgi:hypothetical protein